jgi:CheY-like chemotaxis protein
MRILYAENHAIFAEQVCGGFLSDHSVTVLPSIAAATQALSAQPFDLLIVDYDLDDGKGDALVRAALGLYPGLKIIAASSHDAGNSALLQAGASAVCPKMLFQNILHVIESLFNAQL